MSVNITPPAADAAIIRVSFDIDQVSSDLLWQAAVAKTHRDLYSPGGRYAGAGHRLWPQRYAAVNQYPRCDALHGSAHLGRTVLGAIAVLKRASHHADRAVAAGPDRA